MNEPDEFRLSRWQPTAVRPSTFIERVRLARRLEKSGNEFESGLEEVCRSIGIEFEPEYQELDRAAKEQFDDVIAQMDFDG